MKVGSKKGKGMGGNEKIEKNEGEKGKIGVNGPR